MATDLPPSDPWLGALGSQPGVRVLQRPLLLTAGPASGVAEGVSEGQQQAGVAGRGAAGGRAEPERGARVAVGEGAGGGPVRPTRLDDLLRLWREVQGPAAQ